MFTFHHLLVPTDFSAAARAALETALAVADKFDASLTLLHVVEPQFAAHAEPTSVARSADALEASARLALADIERSVEGRVAVRTVVRRGQAWREILEAVHAEHADLVVMSTHGHTALARALVGGVTDKVVRLSPVRVLTVHGLTTLA